MCRAVSYVTCIRTWKGHMIVNGLDLWWKANSGKVRGNKGRIGKEQQNTTSTLVCTVPHVGDFD